MNPNRNPDVTVDHGGIEESETPRSPTLAPNFPPPPPNHKELLVTTTAAGLCKELGLETALVRAVTPVLIQNLITLEKKQRDYGPHNLTKFGTFGVVVRMNDKMERITNLLKKIESIKDEGYHELIAKKVVSNEPLADSFLDLANYALIAYVMQQNLWPDESR